MAYALVSIHFGYSALSMLHALLECSNKKFFVPKLNIDKSLTSLCILYRKKASCKKKKFPVNVRKYFLYNNLYFFWGGG